jgi:hypothetical protein
MDLSLTTSEVADRLRVAPETLRFWRWKGVRSGELLNVGPAADQEGPAATLVDAAQPYSDRRIWGRKISREQALTHRAWLSSARLWTSCWNSGSNRRTSSTSRSSVNAITEFTFQNMLAQVAAEDMIWTRSGSVPWNPLSSQANNQPSTSPEATRVRS